MKLINITMLLSIFVIVSSCAGAKLRKAQAEAFSIAKPKSILIIPPMNDSLEVNAPYTFLATISNAIAEKGYYVFPVAVIDNYFKQNGLPTPGEMNNAPIDKLIEHLNPDAILYVNINQWGRKFSLFNSKLTVDSDLKLIDSKTKGIIWQSTARDSMSSSSNSSVGGDSFLSVLFSLFASSAASQIVGAAFEETHTMSRGANYVMVNNKSTGLPDGPYIPVEEGK